MNDPTPQAGLDDTPGPPAALVDEPRSASERATDDLLTQAHLLSGHQLPAAISEYAGHLEVSNATVYLADLQQDVLVPFVGPGGPDLNETLPPLAVDTTLAGRAYQLVQVLTQDLADGRLRVWLPLLDGSERLGVVTVVVDDPQATQRPELMARLRRLASLAAELVMTKTLYGDTIVRLRRSAQMGLAAEMQWSLLPPLTFACDRVTIAGALEPAYQVAGDTVDYAVDAGCARAAVFDGMGHGLQSAQLAALTVAAYRNARRSDRSLTDTIRSIDEAVLAGFGAARRSPPRSSPSSTLTSASCNGSAPAIPRRCCCATASSSRPCTSTRHRHSVSGTAPTRPARLTRPRSAPSSSSPATGCCSTPTA